MSIRACIALGGFAIGALLITSTIVYSGDLPEFNMVANCEASARNDASIEEKLKPSFISLCKIYERAFLEDITRKWTAIPNRIQDDCVGLSKSSYELLNKCLDKVLDVYPRSSLPQTYVLFEAGHVTRKFWTIAECMAVRPEGGTCQNH
jgi:hypothetical protein